MLNIQWSAMDALLLEDRFASQGACYRGVLGPFTPSVSSCVSKRSPGPLGRRVFSGVSPKFSHEVSLGGSLRSQPPRGDPREDPGAKRPRRTFGDPTRDRGPEGPEDPL